MKNGAIFAAALLAVACAHAELPSVLTMGSATFSMGTDPETGKINRCGFEVYVSEVSSTSKTPPTMKQVVMRGMLGSFYINSSPKGVYGTTKMAGLYKKSGESEPARIPLNTWWVKPAGQPATLMTGKMIPADNPPYKLSGMSSDDVLRVFKTIIMQENATWYFEPTIQGGAVNFDVKLEVSPQDVEKMFECSTEMLK